MYGLPPYGRSEGCVVRLGGGCEFEIAGDGFPKDTGFLRSGSVSRGGYLPVEGGGTRMGCGGEAAEAAAGVAGGLGCLQWG